MKSGASPCDHFIVTKLSICKFLYPSPNKYKCLPIIPVAVSETPFGTFGPNFQLNGTVVVVLVVRVVVVNVVVIVVCVVDVLVRVVLVRVVRVLVEKVVVVVVVMQLLCLT